MKYQFGTLIFTGPFTGKMRRRDAKEIGVDPNYFFLGSINYDRTVAASVIELCRTQSNCNAYEVYALITHYTRQLIASGTFYHEFPNIEEEHEYMSEEQVRQHLRSVVARSRKGFSKYIPQGIEQIPYTNYYTYTGLNTRAHIAQEKQAC